MWGVRSPKELAGGQAVVQPAATSTSHHFELFADLSRLKSPRLVALPLAVPRPGALCRDRERPVRAEGW